MALDQATLDIEPLPRKALSENDVLLSEKPKGHRVSSRLRMYLCSQKIVHGQTPSFSKKRTAAKSDPADSFNTSTFADRENREHSSKHLGTKQSHRKPKSRRVGLHESRELYMALSGWGRDRLK